MDKRAQPLLVHALASRGLSAMARSKQATAFALRFNASNAAPWLLQMIALFGLIAKLRSNEELAGELINPLALDDVWVFADVDPRFRFGFEARE